MPKEKHYSRLGQYQKAMEKVKMRKKAGNFNEYPFFLFFIGR